MAHYLAFFHLRVEGFENRGDRLVTIDSNGNCDSETKNLALLIEKMPDLEPVVLAWAKLPDAFRAGIVEVVKAMAN